VTQSQQLGSIAAHFAGQLTGADALCHPTQDQHQLRARTPGAMQGRPGEAVENPLASTTLVIDHRRPVATMDTQAIHRPTTWADQAIGVQQFQQSIVTCLFVHEVLNWKVHRLLRERRNYLVQSHASQGTEKSTAQAT